MIVEESDHRPGSVGWVADEVRASAAAWSGSDDEVGRALHLIRDALLVEELPAELARRILVDVVRDRKIDRLGAYVSTALARDGVTRLAERVRVQPHRRASAHDADGAAEAVAAQVAQLRKRPACEHGEPGGDQLHPESGRPLCALCRAGIREPA